MLTHRLASISFTFACAALLATGTPVASAQDTPGNLAISKQNRTIAITATERVLNPADTAVVHIGFVLYGPDKDGAYAAGSNASNAIMAALRGAGIPSDSFESETQSLAETQPFAIEHAPPAERSKRAFTVQQSWMVRAAAADASRVLDLAVKAGANQSGAIEWSLHDPNAAQSSAAAKAIQRARSQAEAMAAGLGVHLGPLLFASNQVEAAPVRPMAVEMRATAAVQKVILPLAINPREIETTATVYAVFALE